MLRDNAPRLRGLLSAADVASCAGIFVLVLTLAPGSERTLAAVASAAWRLLALAMLSCLSWPLALLRWNLYVSRRRRSFASVLFDLMGAGGSFLLVVGAAAFLLRAPVDAIFPVYLTLGHLAVAGALRIALFGGLRLARRAGRNFRNILVLGSGPRAYEVGRKIGEHPEWGLRIVGYVDDGDVPTDSRVPRELVRKVLEVPELLRDEVLDEMIVACPRSMLAEIGAVVQACGLAGVPVTILADLFDDYLPPPRVGSFDSQATLCFAPVHHSQVRLGVKRALDVAGAAAGLLITAPVIALASVAIKLTSPGSVFFGQMRCGLNGRRFTMWKLRTMCADAEAKRAELIHLNEMDGPVFKIRNDPRITPVGRWLRRTSLDELPQLWNVLRGDMSLVGPRPPVPHEVAQYKTSERRRISMRPGLTCLWQVSGRNQISFQDWVKLDLEYIDKWSLSRDMGILLRTVPAVLRGRGAS